MHYLRPLGITCPPGSKKYISGLGVPKLFFTLFDSFFVSTLTSSKFRQKEIIYNSLLFSSIKFFSYYNDEAELFANTIYHIPTSKSKKKKRHKIRVKDPTYTKSRRTRTGTTKTLLTDGQDTADLSCKSSTALNNNILY